MNIDRAAHLHGNTGTHTEATLAYACLDQCGRRERVCGDLLSRHNPPPPTMITVHPPLTRRLIPQSPSRRDAFRPRWLGHRRRCRRGNHQRRNRCCCRCSPLLLQSRWDSWRTQPPAAVCGKSHFSRRAGRTKPGCEDRIAAVNSLARDNTTSGTGGFDAIQKGETGMLSQNWRTVPHQRAAQALCMIHERHTVRGHRLYFFYSLAYQLYALQ